MGIHTQLILLVQNTGVRIGQRAFKIIMPSVPYKSTILLALRIMRHITQSILKYYISTKTGLSNSIMYKIITDNVFLFGNSIDKLNYMITILVVKYDCKKYLHK